MGWPQIILIILCVVRLILVGIQHNNPAPHYSFWRELYDIAFVFILLIWGGFFK